MEFLQNILQSSEFPMLSAFVLGLMMAISPCPLAANITAIGYISKNLENRKKVFYNGAIYTLGRAITYSGIGLLFYFGANQFAISGFVQRWGEKLLGPILLIVGLFMLDVLKTNIHFGGKLNERMSKRQNKGYLDVLLLGIVLALAFCPYSGWLYFGLLIPMTISNASGLYLPVVFAVATGLPVLITAWLIAFSLSNVGNFYNKIKVFEKWFRRIVAVTFIVTGLYFIYIFYF